MKKFKVFTILGAVLLIFGVITQQIVEHSGLSFIGYLFFDQERPSDVSLFVLAFMVPIYYLGLFSLYVGPVLVLIGLIFLFKSHTKKEQLKKL
jgi:hypothetical protein